MKSRAQVAGHPLHPMLVAFPIALFSATLLFDIIGLLTGRQALHIAAGYTTLLGIIGSVAAAIAGIIDYKYTVPPHSSASKRGARHGLLNTAVLVVFTITFYWRHSVETLPAMLFVAEAAGVAIMGVAGYMGGTLVYRNMIGVDMRYAEAGKWREQVIKAVSGMVEIEGAAALKNDQMMLVRVKGKRIVVARSQNEIVAFSDYCPHRGGSLAGGMLMCGRVQCPWHGSQFSVHNGQVQAGPATSGIKTYNLSADNNRYFLSLSDV